jgi:hypothetical protein
MRCSRRSGTTSSWIGTAGGRGQRRRAQRLVDIAPGDASNRTLLADAYRSLGAKTSKPDSEESSNKGKVANRKRLLQRTAEQEQRDLLEGPGRSPSPGTPTKPGPCMRRPSTTIRSCLTHTAASACFTRTSTTSLPRRREYSEYLRLAPADAIDRLRNARRLERVRSEGK